MTISSIVNKVQISSGTNITITNLEAQNSAQVLVTKTDSLGAETTLVITTDYTVNLTVTAVTLLVALVAGETATATLAVPNTQSTDYKNASPFNAETAEDAFDKLTLKNKQQQEEIDRAVKFGLTSVDNLTFASPSGNANKFLKLDSTATIVEYDTISANGLAAIVEDTTPQLGGNLDTNSNDINISEDNVITFEGATSNDFESTLTVVDPTADRVISLPNATDTLVGKATTDTLTNKTLTSPVINTAISGTAFLDEDTLVSDSATKVASQQSIKAYVDSTYISGQAVQVVNVQEREVATGTTTVPFDDTKPQNTEGTEFMALAITPTSSSNKLLIQFVGSFDSTVTNRSIVSLFQDSIADALGTVRTANVTGQGVAAPAVLNHFMTAGTDSLITFKIRAGPSTAATLTFNGLASARSFGGAYASSITITEIQV